MFKKTIVLLLASLSFLFAKAQTPGLKVYEIKSDTAKQLFGVGLEYLQRFDDASGKLNINDVSAPGVSIRFYQLNNKNQYFKENVNSYWLRYRLKNTLRKPVRVIMSGATGIFEYYMQLPDNQWYKQTIGTRTPWKDMSGFKRSNLVYYELQAGQEALFYKHLVVKDEDLTSYLSSSNGMGLNLWYYDQFVQNELNNDKQKLVEIETLGLMGFMLLAGLVGLAMYGLVKDKIYLYFGLATLCFSIILGNLPVVLFSRYYPAYDKYFGTDLIISLLFYYQWRFFDLFFEFSKHFRRAGKILLWLTLCFSVVAYLPGIIPGKYWQAFSFALLGYVIVAPLTVLFCFIHPKTTSRAKIFAALPLIVGMTYIIIAGLCRAIFKTNVTLGYGQELIFLSVCWLVISFIRMLLKRLINTIQQNEAERTRLIIEQNTQLELKVEERTAELKTSIDTLKATQRQLIQSEKMASLGELTAGIAHEIQNPLNFINNFSEVSVELMAEMKEEITAGNLQDGLEIAADIETNLQKITAHGKRADGIVKGMLQHSRVSSDKKELSDINTLADEYLRLSYHGLRAKDKNFNSAFETGFAGDIPNLDLVPQDMGRVLLNLFNNAFYSVWQKKKLHPDFSPLITITTARVGDFVEIKVRDNGLGIPKAVVDKIYQPFFTTKPTGEGTGLGLSLSYDIVTNIHHGQLLVDTVEGEFAEFTVRIPVI